MVLEKSTKDKIVQNSDSDYSTPGSVSENFDIYCVGYYLWTHDVCIMLENRGGTGVAGVATSSVQP